MKPQENYISTIFIFRPSEVFLDSLVSVRILRQTETFSFEANFIPGSEETLDTDRRGQAGDAEVIS